MKKETFITIDYSDFDELVNKNIPSAKGQYEFVAEQEANNSSCYKFEGVGKYCKDNKPDCSYRKFDVPDIENGKLQFRARWILEYLCEKGIIKPGNYLIEVYW